MMDPQTVTSVASAGVAALSAGVSVYYSHKATQHAERSAQCQYEDNIRVWAERTVDVTGQLVELLSNEGGETEFSRNRSTLLAVLRCQIDKGRLYFPNIHTDKKGAWKPPAFRGIRQPIIDVLVNIYEASKTADWSTRPSAHQGVEDLHRKFVSEVQHRLNPSERDANYRRYVNQVSAQFVQESLVRPDRTGAVDGSERAAQAVSRVEPGVQS
jgi:hypothetical protein